MTVSTIDELLGESYGLIVAVLVAVAALASAIVGLWMLNYLVNVITGATRKVKKL